MREHGAALFLRSRALGVTLAALGSLTVVGVVFGRVVLRILDSSDKGVPWAVVVPAALAAAVGVGQHAPLAGMERLAARSMPRWRLAYATGLCAVGFLASWLVAVPIVGDPGAPAALRNFSLMAGCALASCAVVDARLSWILPIAWTAMATSVGVGADGQPRSWAIPIMPNGQPIAVTIAAAVLILGLATVSLHPHRADIGSST